MDEQNQVSFHYKKIPETTKTFVSLGLFVLVLVILGVSIYFVGYNANHSSLTIVIDTEELLKSEISADNIGLYLKNLSSVPHLAGTAQDLEQAEWLRDDFLKSGLDEAVVVPYTVLLSYPDMEMPNHVFLIDNNGVANFTTDGRQKRLFSPEENSEAAAPNFNAYSATGIFDSDGLVYVYYGLESHYDYLAERGINVTNKIVLARYGGTFRGNIVNVAEKRGAKGVLLYSDPIDFAQQGRDFVYPDSWWMPGMAVQLGSVYSGHGDPLTPFYPSVEGAYYVSPDNRVPSIPVQPIGYDEAEIFLRAMKEGELAPEEWRGTLSTEYYLGPDLKYPNWTIKMDIRTANRMATIYNTIGLIRGEIEPDRYVIVGNHRDAWILGSLDPSGGTACMLEMARSFGKIKKNSNWRPRRSLLFCSWGAEEYGIIGSTEWAEEYGTVLGQRAVAYLNTDVAVNGNYSLRALSTPLLRKVLVESSKTIANPDPSEIEKGRPTIYDTWLHRYPDPVHELQPKVGTLGSGSDFTPFMHNLGVPSLHFLYMYQEDIANFPLYHTGYETYYLLADIIDSGLVHHVAITQLWTEIARRLIESEILPIDVTWYAIHLTDSFNAIQLKYGERLAANNVKLDFFKWAIGNFSTVASEFQNTVLSLDIKNQLAVRRVNDQMMQLERQFIDPHGLPNRTDYNHIVFAPSSIDSYASASFCGLTDLLELVGNSTSSEKPAEWAQIEQHLSVIAFFVKAAGKSLLPVEIF